MKIDEAKELLECIDNEIEIVGSEAESCKLFIKFAEIKIEEQRKFGLRLERIHMKLCDMCTADKEPTDEN